MQHHVDSAFPATALVVGVTSHRDLVAEDLPELRQVLTSALTELRNQFPELRLVLLSPLAEGGDLLFAEVGLQLGAHLIVPLPLPLDLYAQDFSPGSCTQFKCLLAQAEVIRCRGRKSVLCERHHVRTQALGKACLWAGIGISLLLALFHGVLVVSVQNILVTLMGALSLVAAVREAYAYRKADKELVKQYRFMYRIYRNVRIALDAAGSKRRLFRVVVEIRRQPAFGLRDAGTPALRIVHSLFLRHTPHHEVLALRMTEVVARHCGRRQHREVLGQLHAGIAPCIEQAEQRRLLAVFGARWIARRRSDAAIRFVNELRGVE